MTRDELIAALEKAEEGSRGLDGEVYRLIENGHGVWHCFDGVWHLQDPSDLVGFQAPPEYTGSIDAALTLVPAGWDWSVVLAERFEDKTPASCQVIQRGSLKFYTTHAITPA